MGDRQKCRCQTPSLARPPARPFLFARLSLSLPRICTRSACSLTRTCTAANHNHNPTPRTASQLAHPPARPHLAQPDHGIHINKVRVPAATPLVPPCRWLPRC